MGDNFYEKDMPRIDLPEDWLVGTDIDPKLLSLYTDFPVRLKCEIFILCQGGEVEASVNLNRFCVHQNEAVLLVPGTIFQIHKVSGELKIYFLGFSSGYIKGNPSQHLVDACCLLSESPVISLCEESSKLLGDYLGLLIRLYEFLDENFRHIKVVFGYFPKMSSCFVTFNGL